jgi:hypothetical protein
MSQEQEAASDASPKTGPALDMALYERLIEDGIAQASKQGGAVDHVTARRLAIWLAAQRQQRDFAGSLALFIETGAISQQLLVQLRAHSRSPGYIGRAQAIRLMQYCASRQFRPGPVGPDFGAACDQVDQADALLVERRDRIRQNARHPAPASSRAQSETSVRATRNSRTVSLTLDPSTASIALFAITASAADHEARAREADQSSQALPEGSYGRQNRQAIAAREMNAATRLRAIERAYQNAIDYEPPHAYDPTAPIHATDHEIELE